MKKFTVMLAALVLAVACLAPVTAMAFEAEGDVYLGFYDKYLWRGFDLSGSMPVSQGGVDVTMGAFTVSYWSNMQLKNDSGEGFDAGEITETDITLDYSRDINDLVSISLGNIFYALDGLEDTNELYLTTSLNVLLAPSVTVYYDWDKAKKNGLFFALGIGHTFELMDKLSISPGLTVTYNDESDYAVGNYKGWHNVESGFTVDYALTEDIALAASFQSSTGLCDDAKKAIDTETVAGLSATLSF
jgi:uncharacterized protein (TIGR02001 family)